MSLTVRARSFDQGLLRSGNNRAIGRSRRNASPCWPCETGSGASSQTVLRHPPAPCSRRPARSARHPGRRPSFARFDIRGARMGPKGQVWRALTQEVAPGGPAVCRIERNLALRPPWAARFMSNRAKIGLSAPLGNPIRVKARQTWLSGPSTPCFPADMGLSPKGLVARARNFPAMPTGGAHAGGDGAGAVAA